MRPETADVFPLPLERLLEDQNCNIRIFYGDIDQLAVELMTEGQREPIKVREQAGEYYVVDGHRRQRALLRSLQLRIVPEEGRFLVYEGCKPLREAAGPQHPGHDPRQVRCQLVECGADADRLFASSLVHNLGKPFTFLERNLFLSRLLRQGGRPAEALALKIGFSLADIAAARRLYAADPRLLEQVRLGRISQKLALRILRTYPAVDQIVRIKAARVAAEALGRDQLLPEDFEWAEREEEADRAEAEEERSSPADPVHARLSELVARLGEAAHSPPNAAAEDRLATLLLIYRYAIGQISYNPLEAHLMGRH
ncbi:MAG TPA: ParB N-terminal domain-containing protein [Opitutaceae bacterium]|nr:ParB N-terminal domain-containing protein [Opitutaceae bacterium]